MTQVKIRPYLSPSVVLLAFDWPDGADKDDFLGFAIERKPGFDGKNKSWLPNRIGFSGPAPGGKDVPSNDSPVQKFMWWDARIDQKDIQKTFTYTIMPVVGTVDNHHLVDEASNSIDVKIPKNEVNNIGTDFISDGLAVEGAIYHLG